jgi:hypothetical protein
VKITKKMSKTQLQKCYKKNTNNNTLFCIGPFEDDIFLNGRTTRVALFSSSGSTLEEFDKIINLWDEECERKNILSGVGTI